MSVSQAVRSAVDWISEGYRPRPRPFALLRVLFALQVLVIPRDILWIADIPAQFFDPPPGPFALLTGPPSPEFLLGFTVVRAVIALWLLVGWKTLYASAATTVALLVASGLSYSYSKVDHFILYDLAPLAFGIAGWGAAWSIDALRGKGTTRGYPMLLFGITIAFALLTAAIPKIRGGWWDPSREATHLYLARDAFTGGPLGPLSGVLLQMDSAVLWKLLDYGTLFAEGWMIVAVFSPGLFRLGLFVITGFHIGVYLSLGIDFFNNVWAYAGFFCLGLSAWFPELRLLRDRRARRRAERAEVPAD